MCCLHISGHAKNTPNLDRKQGKVFENKKGYLHAFNFENTGAMVWYKLLIYHIGIALTHFPSFFNTRHKADGELSSRSLGAFIE